MSYGNVYAPDALTVVRNGGTELQKRRPFASSRSSQLVDARLSVVTPPNSRYLAPRALTVNSKQLFVVLFDVEYVTMLLVATLTSAGVRVFIVIGSPESGSR